MFVIPAGELIEDDLLTAVIRFLQHELGDAPPLQPKTLVKGFMQDRAAKLLVAPAAQTGVSLS